MKSGFPAPGSAVVFRGVGGVLMLARWTNGLTSRRGGSMGLESGTQVLNKQENPFQRDRRWRPVCTEAAGTEQRAGSERPWSTESNRFSRVLPSPCVRFTSGRSCSSRLTLCFGSPLSLDIFVLSKHVGFRQFLKPTAVVKSRHRTLRTHMFQQKSSFSGFTVTVSADLNLLYLDADVPVWRTKETFRDKQSCLSFSRTCFYF